MRLLLTSVGALLITALLWPITAWVRHRYQVPLHLDPSSLRAYRLSKIAAILILAALGLWTVTLVLMIKNNTNFAAHFDPLLWLDQIFGTLVFVGGLAAMLWNLRAVWRGKRRWPARAWSVVLSVSAVTVLWVAVVCRFIAFGTNY
jgi:hypothetical protein